MEKILSIIVPTYNMERLLEKCLSSFIIKQMNLLEIIVVNDGSKDRSSSIAHNFEGLYPNVFKVVDKKNGNYGSCINIGLSLATGKYVKVCDADDSFCSNELEKYVDCLSKTNADMVISNYSVINDLGKKMNCIDFSFPSNRTDNIQGILTSVEFKKIQMHAIAYKRSIFSKFMYKQTEGIPYTDQEWIFMPMMYVETYLYLKYDVYQYLVGREGQTVDPKVAIRNLPHNITVLKSRLSFYKNNKNSLHKELISYYEYKLCEDALFIYRYILFKKALNLELLLELDDYIHMIDKQLYKTLGGASFIGYHYVKNWRKNRNKHLFFLISSLYRFLYKILKSSK
jgi:glycosyltransferase involved in cell wall biosynthesis